jgi:hypothetical protein
MTFAVAGVALAMFVLLCANEMFAQPPLMTPAFRPSPELVGSWQGDLKLPQEVAVDLRVDVDGSVHGAIGNAAVIEGRITFNRSWFGRLMNWRTDYLIRGRLSGALESGGAAGHRFAAPLNLRTSKLTGSMFLSNPRRPMPLRLELTRH